ncbi:MAG: acyl-CoA thioesterase, partial [Peptococcaceae bacterium]|nr:acyl-CoA thioesterase [Peptococcaceae bacterium]
MAEHSYKHKVHYYETDQMGMVHHSNYIRWFEEARVDYLDAIGLPYKQMEEEGIGSPVLEMHCQYKSRVTFGETVTIRVKMKSYTGLRYTVAYEVIGEDDKLRCTGESGHCFMTTAGRP